MSISQLKYIAIEGPIGVGKTTLARMLAEEFRFRLALESPESNPFMGDFYKDRSRYAFQTQLFFLLSRYQQQKELAQLGLFEQGVVSDYILAKDHLFASLNLSPDELQLYESIYPLLDAKVLKPDLVIFLQASTEVLKDRIKQRNIPYEKNIDFSYLDKLSSAYNDFFFHYQQTPLLVVNCSEVNWIENSTDYQNLLKEILHMKKNNLEKHYVSISSQ